MRKSLLKSMERYPQHLDILSVKQFCLGTLYTNVELGHVSGMYGLTILYESEVHNPKREANNVYDQLEYLDERVVVAEAELVCTAIESLHAMEMENVNITIFSYQLGLSVLGLLFSIRQNTVDDLLTRIVAMDQDPSKIASSIKEHSMYLHPLEVYEETVAIFQSKKDLLSILCRIHALVSSLLLIPPKFQTMLQEALSPMEPYADRVGKKTSRPSAFVNPYVENMLHLALLDKHAKMLLPNQPLQFCPSESIDPQLTGVDLNYPTFVCSIGEMSVAAGGCCSVDYKLVDKGLFRRLFFYCEYFFPKLVLQKHRMRDPDTTASLPKVDVVITCQDLRLFPTAHALLGKVLDAGFSCECRASPLEHDDDFNKRLRSIKGIGVAVHLYNRGSIEGNQDGGENDSGSSAEHCLDNMEKQRGRTFYLVECIQSIEHVSKRFDCEYEAFRFIKSRLATSGRCTSG
ncbi:hypothetical protein BdWA1_000390 [Babesia duncani]|uniref:Uncharacterized protein n=1 Tax=Babesia duncani TaxID=323732 RepID=A0AAD9PM32_9APIC|nr:hypothetical protein BdWA1_000390 [Babesia duncani]